MSQSVNLPALGESVTEGTVTRWLKKVGDHVDADEPLLEVSTDKVDTEIPSPVAGVVEKILVDEDETVEVGTELAVVGAGDGAASPEEAPSGAPSVAAESAPASPASQAPASVPAEPEPTPPPAAPSGQGTAITLPALGESVTEGTVTRWLKKVGDHVDADEPLLEVSTDKVDTEIPSPVAGTLSQVVVGEDETAEVGATLAYVGAADTAGRSGGTEPVPAPPEAAAEPSEQPEAPSTDAEAPQPAPVAVAPAPEPVREPAHATAPAAAPAPSTNGAYVTPLVRKLAREQGIDLARLTGTGVGGRIRKQDVLEAAEQAAREAAERAEEERRAAEARTAGPAPAPVAPQPSPENLAKRGTTEKMTRLRRVIAQRMVESLQVSAQLTTVVEVDVTRIAELRNRAKRSFLEREGVKLSFLPFFALATVEALKVHPTVNASIEGENIVYHASENLGVAVDTPRGLLVPVIKDAGDLNIAGFARRIADLAERTRTNKVTPDELAGGTFTLTNTGSRGALFDTPIINQPQVGILGTGSVVKRPVVVADADGRETIGVRSMVYLAISYDHRLVDGADAARFLGTIKNRLEEGAFESQLGL